METKLSKVRAAYESGDLQGALRIAAKFHDLGAERDAILRAHESYANASFYAQLGKAPEQLRAEGAAALARRYGFGAFSSSSGK